MSGNTRAPSANRTAVGCSDGSRERLPFTVPLAVLLALYVGVHYGSFAAAGSDSYGYVSQARLWLSGIPRVEQPWVQDFSWPNREWVFSPLGYRPFSPDGTIVPTYPAGLPMVMAVFLALFGDNGPFYVVPVLAAFTLWFTYLLGREATGSRVVAGIGGAAAPCIASLPDACDGSDVGRAGGRGMDAGSRAGAETAASRRRALWRASRSSFGPT